MSAQRTLAAWQRGDKFYLSAFRLDKVHVNGKTPAAEFNSKAELEIEVRRRKALVDWEREEPSNVP